jgi:hypothetical protein
VGGVVSRRYAPLAADSPRESGRRYDADRGARPTMTAPEPHHDPAGKGTEETHTGTVDGSLELHSLVGFDNVEYELADVDWPESDTAATLEFHVDGAGILTVSLTRDEADELAHQLHDAARGSVGSTFRGP